MTATLATLRGVSVAYRGGPDVLTAIDLDIRQGERLAIIGESGSGKSTLALALAGLLPPGAHVRGDMDWPALAASPVPGRDIGFVFQDGSLSLNPVLSIGEQVAESVRAHSRASWREAHARALQLLQRVRIPDPASAIKAYPHQLSGGQRQRVGIASAIASMPRLLIADEPTSALDTIVQAQVVALLDELVREDGMTLLFITHDLALASSFADRIAVFAKGRLVEVSDAAALITHPTMAESRALIGSAIDLETSPLVSDTA